MKYEEFVECLYKQLCDKLEGRCQVLSEKIAVLNEGEKGAFVFKVNQAEIAPIIFQMQLYEKYLGGVAIEHIVGTICENLCGRNFGVSIESIGEWNWAEEKLFFRLVPYEANKEMLKAVPHIEVLDLAVVFYVMLEVDKGSQLVTMVGQKLMELWGVRKGVLWETALNNTPEILPVSIATLSEMIVEFCQESGMSLIPEELEVSNETYVLTNQYQNHGAACMLYPKVLEKFAEKIGSDIYILPSSVHEVMLVPANEYLDEKRLEEMVCIVNKTEVDPEDILSSHVYHFSRKSGIISICGKNVEWLIG